jgi:hypothetical protein
VVLFDDERAVADAGIVLPATLAARLGVEALVEQTVDLGERPGAANPSARVMTLVSAMALGADCVDDCDLLRAGRTGQVLGHEVAAPSTLGTFLAAFTFGHVRQLDRVLGQALARAWAAGAGPGAGRLVVDVDSFVGEVHGRSKQGAAFGYTRQRGYHQSSPPAPTPARACRWAPSSRTSSARRRRRRSRATWSHARASTSSS